MGRSVKIISIVIATFWSNKSALATENLNDPLVLRLSLDYTKGRQTSEFEDIEVTQQTVTARLDIPVINRLSFVVGFKPSKVYLNAAEKYLFDFDDGEEPISLEIRGKMHSAWTLATLFGLRVNAFRSRYFTLHLEALAEFMPRQNTEIDEVAIVVPKIITADATEQVEPHISVEYAYKRFDANLHFDLHLPQASPFLIIGFSAISSSLYLNYDQYAQDQIDSLISLYTDVSGVSTTLPKEYDRLMLSPTLTIGTEFKLYGPFNFILSGTFARYEGDTFWGYNLGVVVRSN